MKSMTMAILAVIASVHLYAQNDSTQYFLAEGNKKFESGLYNAAQKDFEKAAQADPTSIEAHLAVAKVDMKTNRIYQAGQNLNKAYELAPDNKEVIRLLMEWNFNNRQHQKAIELAEKCDCEENERVVGMSYYRMENYGKAEAHLLKALKKNAGDAEAAYALGRTYLELENNAATIKYYQMAVEANPGRAAWQYELALLYYNSSDYKKALQCFDAAVEAGIRQDNDFLENIGFCQLYAGDIENAMKSLNQVMERKPNSGSLMSDIAYAMYSTKRYQGAIEFYEKALTINPGDAKSLFMAGMSFQKMGNKEKGQALCDKAIEMDPSLARNRQKKDGGLGL